jgi:alkylated DNA repair dioxygenase AlkB
VTRIQLEFGAYLELLENWLEPSAADALFHELVRVLPLTTRTLRMFGRELPEPRLVAYLGEPGTAYTYSGRRNEPAAIVAPLAPLFARLTDELGLTFNAVLANLYRDGNDGMGMHSDSEPELGPEPVIASLSLGAPRRFRLEQRATRHKLDLTLPNGSLLLMLGSTQRHYRHGVPKQRSLREPRLNLTFRRVWGS